MKKNFPRLLFLLVTFLLPFTARAGTFNILDDFDGLSAQAFVTDNPSWVTTDLWQNNGVIARAGGQAAWLGGLYDGPTTPTAYLSRGFNPEGNTLLTFRWTQNIANASTDDGVRDKFGWTITSTTGANLLTLMFLNVNLPGQNLLAQGYSGSLSGSPITNSSNLGVSNRGEWAEFKIVLDTSSNTWGASLFDAAANNGEGGWQNFISGGSVNGSEYTVGAFSAVWDLQNKSTTRQDVLADETPVTLYSGAGKNIMMFDNLSISGVPEPSSLSLLAFGSLVLLATRRRRS